MNIVKLRFKIDSVALFRSGIGASGSTALLEIDPATLPKDQRELIGSHLLPDETSDVFNVVYDPVRAKQSGEVVPLGGRAGADLIEAKAPTLDSLSVALAECG